MNQEDFPPEDFEPRAFFRPQRAMVSGCFLSTARLRYRRCKIIFFSGTRSSLMKGDEQLSRSIYLWFIWSMYWCTCLITWSRNIKNISENRCLKECRIAEKWSTNDWRPPQFHIFHVGEWTSPIDAHRMSNASKRIHSTPILTYFNCVINC